MGHVTRQHLLWATTLVTYHIVKSLQLIWKSGTPWWNLRASDLQMSYSDLSSRYDIQDISSSNCRQGNIPQAWPVPCVLHFSLFCSLIPESPQWLLLQGRKQDAARVMKDIALINNKPLPPGFDLSEIQEVSTGVAQPSVSPPPYRFGDFGNLRKQQQQQLKFIWMISPSDQVYWLWASPEIINFWSCVVEPPPFPALWLYPRLGTHSHKNAIFIVAFLLQYYDEIIEKARVSDLFRTSRMRKRSSILLYCWWVHNLS